MERKDDEVYLLHIRDAIAKIEKYMKGVKQEEFYKNSLLQDGVIRQIAIIGEAAKRLSESFKGAHPDIPWSKMVGMRNKLIHDYLGVDYESVWKTTEDDIPMLKAKVNALGLKG